ncbi:MAG: hypothetical protein KA100_01930 [Rickettsiales bacterium]|nr:hypothetical protein [Rickettsiales bacterium]
MKAPIAANLTGFTVESLEEYFSSFEGCNTSSRKTGGLLPDSNLEGMTAPAPGRKPKVKSPEASTFVWVQGESKTK